MVLLEVCVDSVQGALAAQEGGAGRVELCSSLAEGGITPSYGLIKAVRQVLSSCDLHVLIRPRGGDFLYSPEELQVMAEDTSATASLGAQGVVFGMLAADGSIDAAQLQRLVHLATGKGLCVTFHRAFDMVCNQRVALRDLITAGVPRVLTSGGKPTALEGADAITDLVREAAGAIIIMAGGGVRPSNALELVRRTGVCEIHSSASRRVASSMQHRHSGCSMCASQPFSDWAWTVTDAGLVRALVDAVGPQ